MSERNLGKKILTSKFFMLFCLAVLVFFVFNLASEVINRRDLQQEIKELETDINNLAGRNQELGGLIEYYKTMDFVETEARTKLNLRKPDEHIIIVPPALTDKSKPGETDSRRQTVVLTKQNQQTANIVKWWNYFFQVN